MKLAGKFARIVLAMFVYGLGVSLAIQANIGLAPWEAFHAGCALATGLSFGTVSMLAGVIILVIDVIMKEKIGFGTVINTILIGKVVDLLLSLQLMRKVQNLYVGIAVLLLGQFLICLATFLYISAGLGSGPRDSLMVALGKRLPGVPIGAVKGVIEGTVLLIGWLLGAKVGLGTVISVLSISLIMQWTFTLLRFKVREVRHESIAETLRAIRKSRLGLNG